MPLNNEDQALIDTFETQYTAAVKRNEKAILKRSLNTVIGKAKKDPIDLDAIGSINNIIKNIKKNDTDFDIEPISLEQADQGARKKPVSQDMSSSQTPFAYGMPMHLQQPPKQQTRSNRPPTLPPPRSPATPKQTEESQSRGMPKLLKLAKKAMAPVLKKAKEKKDKKRDQNVQTQPDNVFFSMRY